MSKVLAIDTRRAAFYISGAVFCLVSIYYLLSANRSTGDSNMGNATATSSWTYKTVPGFFLQDDAAIDPEKLDNIKQNFGLINRSYDTDVQTTDTDAQTSDTEVTQWQRFHAYLTHLTATAPQDTKYKLLYLARHGEGYHNVAESYYGTKAWDARWSKLEGNATVTWSDALLTDDGKEQAREAGAFLAEQFIWAGMPVPEGWYVSPLMRCLQTLELTWSNIKLDSGKLVRPVVMVKEKLREVMGVHTCDRRSSRTVIQQAYPDWEIEKGFAEEDELWEADHRETFAEHDERTTQLLDDIFAHDDGKVLSLTAHSGAIASFLRVTGHRLFRLPTGGMMPLFVKATRGS